MSRSEQLAYLRTKPVLIALGCALVVVLVWLFAFFLPQGSKASKLSAQEQSLQQQVTRDNAKLAILKKTSQATPQLEALLSKYQGYVPSQPDVLSGPNAYVDLLDSTASASGVKLTSITPGAVAAVPGLAFSGIPISLSVSGSYGAIETFLQSLYSLPRLTSVQSISLTGGGPGNGAAAVTGTMSLQIYTTAKPAS